MVKDNEWCWAAKADDDITGNRFLIARNEEDLWQRVRMELDPHENCHWEYISEGEPTIEDMFNLYLVNATSYGVSHNRFMLEAAQVPVFAKFLRGSKFGLCNYVDNPSFFQPVPGRERYSPESMRTLESAISATLGIEAGWAFNG